MSVYRDTLCESGPTRQGDREGDIRRLANIGCKLSHNSASADRFDEFRPRIWEKVRQGIDAGQPAIGWDLAESIIFGYDDDSNYLYFDLDGKAQRVPYEQIAVPHVQ